MPKDKKTDKKDIIPTIIMAFLFLIVYGLALLIIGPFQAAGMEAFENPDDPLNIVYIFIILLIVTGVILLIAKYWKKQLIQIIILFAIGYTSFYVFYPLYALAVTDLIALVLSITSAVFLVIALFKFPEWYVINICGIIVGAGAIAIFGISLGILLVIIFLIALAVYDAVSVYKTKHMIDLADTVLDLKLPVMLVIPKIKHYSFIKETKSLKEKIKQDEERDAFFMGLGDVVMPGILVAAVYANIEQGLPIALSVILGTLIGFVGLMFFVIKGKPQAGLPFLCTGAILGYVISSLIYYNELVGLTFSF